MEEGEIISVMNATSGNKLFFLRRQPPQTSAEVAEQVATTLGLPEYRIRLHESGDEGCFYYYVPEPGKESEIISVKGTISGNELLRLQPPQTSAGVAEQVATKLGLPQYQIRLVDTGDEDCFYYYVAEPGNITAEVVRRVFPNCRLCRRDRALYSDQFPSEFFMFPNPKTHLGRRLGTIGGEDIILRGDLKLIAWRSLKKYDPQEWSYDYQCLRSAGLEEMYMSLPVLQ